MDASTALEFLVGRIPQYPQYTDEVSRRRSDMLVRSYVGEALALARERFAPELDGVVSASLEVLILHCQFTDQIFVKHLEHSDLDEHKNAGLLLADRSLVEHADQLPSVQLGEFGAFIERIEAAFAARTQVIA